VWTKRNHTKPEHRYKTKPTLKEYARKYQLEIKNATTAEQIAEAAADEEENSI